MTVLVDTSVLLAYAFNRDSNHEAASRLVRSLQHERQVIALSVLTELFYLTSVRVNYRRAVQTYEATRTAFRIEPLNDSDLQRMGEILNQYQQARLDFTDVAIMALAERLNITRICTFDRRDFPIFRPKHCDALELLP